MAFPPGNVGLVFGLAGRKERLSLESLTEKLDDRGRPGHTLGAAWLASGQHSPG